nr:PREDICTED: putative ATP-dependent RNA helicase TDRD12 isoform X2 [Megachile rotundata]
MDDQSLFNEGTTIPSTATLIQVTNILTPYIIRVYEVKNYEERLHSISKKLLIKKGALLNNNTVPIEPKLGDMVIVCSKLDIKLDTWLCRGYIYSVAENLEDTYNVFLPDYGIPVLLHKKDFVVHSSDLISEEYLSFTIGLYNILPAAIKNDSSMNEDILTVLEDWTISATQYVKELISVSTAIYFDHLVSDQCGRQYGELYLNIENNIVCLTKALICNNYAIYIGSDLLKLIKNPESYENLDKKLVNSETVFYINSRKEYKTCDKLEKQKSSYLNGVTKFPKKKHICSETKRDQEKVLICTQIKCECLTSTLDAKFPTEIHKLPQGVNPSALVLCSSSSEVLEVYYLCRELLQSYKKIKCVAAINGKSERSLVAEMYNGCNILVSTPRFLARFIDQNRKLLNFKNLQHLVLDGGDVILDKYFDSISKLFKKHNIICNREVKYDEMMLQIIVTARHWTPCIKRVAYILMNNPYICITSFIEATVFKSICPKVYVMKSKSKNEKLLDILNNNKCSSSRTAIVCASTEEAESLHKFLSNYKDALLLHAEMNFLHLQNIARCWNTCVHGSYPILICTDDILSDISITNVTWLIHYSISLRSKTQFNYRFSMLFENLQMEHCNCKVTIIVDDNSDMQFISIMKILQRMNVSIPQNILQNIEFITAALEKKKENYPICNNIKSWGFCDKQYSCIFRHRLVPEIDAPITNIQIKDRVKFRVISIHDVTHISARVISYIKSDTLEEIEFSNVEYIQITMKIQEFYSCVENRRRCDTIELGRMYGLEEPVDNFKRVEVLNIENDGETETPEFVDVRCVDNGVILTKVHVYRLLHMPEKLVEYPVQVMEVFLVGITPHDDEYVWNNCAIDAVYEWFKENIDEKSYVIGTVNLHLGNTIWVNTLEVGTKIIGYKDLVGSSLRADLLNKDHAIENPKHLHQMYQLCKTAGFSDINGFNLDTLINKNS